VTQQFFVVFISFSFDNYYCSIPPFSLSPDVNVSIIVYYAIMAADKYMYMKYTQKYKDKKAEVHDKIID